MYLKITLYNFLGSKLDRDRDTTSQDSGISQMSDNIKDPTTIIEERMEELMIRPNFSVRSGSRSLPYANVNGVTETDSNGFRSLGIFKIKQIYLFSYSVNFRRNKRL